ncbi:MAG: peptidylprolyl isomerase [Gemmatimonadota bacterium]|nr:peptidylprolyl isomerase [Gemmatimonadota bacterium]
MNRPRPIPPALALALAVHLSACESAPSYNPMLLTPESLTETAPDVFQARFETSKGDFVIEVHREWSPRGADRFYNLVANGYYDNVRFFRVIAGFMAQFGIHGDTEVSAAWREQRIDDDPVVQSNTRGFVSYAKGDANTRTTQIFINFGDNSRLDPMGFSPFGQVVEGMEVVDRIYSGYGNTQPNGTGPNPPLIHTRGNEYLDEEYPNLDFVTRATIADG